MVSAVETRMATTGGHDGRLANRVEAGEEGRQLALLREGGQAAGGGEGRAGVDSDDRDENTHRDQSSAKVAEESGGRFATVKRFDNRDPIRTPRIWTRAREMRAAVMMTREITGPPASGMRVLMAVINALASAAEEMTRSSIGSSHRIVGLRKAPSPNLDKCGGCVANNPGFTRVNLS